MTRAKQQIPDRAITPGSDFLQLDIDTAPAGGMADWLAAELRRAIADGRLTVGARLPASRILAADLGVSRGVVTDAYQRIVDDGHVVGRGRAGTVVVGVPTSPPPSAPARPAVEVFGGQPGVESFDVLRDAVARIDLSPGVPDLAAFPRAAWLRAERTVLATLAPADFGYGDPRGTPALRVAVAGWLARNRGISVDPAEVVVVAGVAQALVLLAQVLRERGIATIAVEEPGSLGARDHLRNWHQDTPPVTVDSRGLDVDALRATGAPAVMVTPAHQFPTGVVLDGQRRRELLRWAEAGGLVIEDDYDAEHRYDRPPVPALRSVLPDVCYCGSVSKTLAPALRIGWLLVPEEYRAAVVAAKRNADLGNAALPQLVLAELMTSGALERHLRLIRRRHVRRRDAMTAALARYLPDARIHGAAAGLHLMVTLESDVDDTAWATACLARGVKVQPLSWHSQLPSPPGLVLGYAANSPSDIDTAVRDVAEALSSSIS